METRQYEKLIRALLSVRSDSKMSYNQLIREFGTEELNFTVTKYVQGLTYEELLILMQVVDDNDHGIIKFTASYVSPNMRRF